MTIRKSILLVYLLSAFTFNAALVTAQDDQDEDREAGVYSISAEAAAVYEQDIAPLDDLDVTAILDPESSCGSISMLRMVMNNVADVDLPDDVTVDAVDAGGVSGAWFTPADALEDDVLYYLHGGAFVFNSVETYTPFLMWLAHLSGYRIFAIDYRLAPEHPYPAGLEDTETAYRWLLDQGYAPEQIAIGGDSAGGNLAASLLLRLRDAGEPLPAAGWLYAPVVDFTRASTTEKGNDALGAIYATMNQCYLDGMAEGDPAVSPLFADLSGLPPLLITTGTRDTGLGAHARFARVARTAGVDVTLDVWDGMWHVWSQGYPLLPESMMLHENFGIWLDAVMGN